MGDETCVTSLNNKGVGRVFVHSLRCKSVSSLGYPSISGSVAPTKLASSTAVSCFVVLTGEAFAANQVCREGVVKRTLSIESNRQTKAANIPK